VRGQIAGEDAGVDVRAILAEAAKGSGAGIAGRGSIDLYIAFFIVQV
jgi:hypothetical protein